MKSNQLQEDISTKPYRRKLSRTKPANLRKSHPRNSHIRLQFL